MVCFRHRASRRVALTQVQVARKIKATRRRPRLQRPLVNTQQAHSHRPADQFAGTPGSQSRTSISSQALALTRSGSRLGTGWLSHSSIAHLNSIRAAGSPNLCVSATCWKSSLMFLETRPENAQEQKYPGHPRPSCTSRRRCGEADVCWQLFLQSSVLCMCHLRRNANLVDTPD
jgi:hypothetical protein